MSIDIDTRLDTIEASMRKLNQQAEQVRNYIEAEAVHDIIFNEITNMQNRIKEVKGTLNLVRITLSQKAK